VADRATGAPTAVPPPDGAVATAYARLHADAVRLMGDWRAPDEQQERLRRDYLSHLAAHPDGVAKAGPPAHLTASVLVLDPTATQALLTLHRKAGAWLQFGGHLEPEDPSLYAAAVREAREESGLDSILVAPVVAQLDRHVLRGAFGRCREHLDVRFAGVAPDGARPRVSEESDDVRWWPLDRLPDGSAAELTGLVAAVRRVHGRSGS